VDPLPLLTVGARRDVLGSDLQQVRSDTADPVSYSVGWQQLCRAADAEATTAG
jgi:hypothetical protein